MGNHWQAGGAPGILAVIRYRNTQAHVDEIKATPAEIKLSRGIVLKSVRFSLMCPADPPHPSKPWVQCSSLLALGAAAEPPALAAAVAATQPGA